MLSKIFFEHALLRGDLGARIEMLQTAASAHRKMPASRCGSRRCRQARGGRTSVGAVPRGGVGVVQCGRRECLFTATTTRGSRGPLGELPRPARIRGLGSFRRGLVPLERGARPGDSMLRITEFRIRDAQQNAAAGRTTEITVSAP